MFLHIVKLQNFEGFLISPAWYRAKFVRCNAYTILQAKNFKRNNQENQASKWFNLFVMDNCEDLWWVSRFTYIKVAGNQKRRTWTRTKRLLSRMQLFIVHRSCWYWQTYLRVEHFFSLKCLQFHRESWMENLNDSKLHREETRKPLMNN